MMTLVEIVGELNTLIKKLPSDPAMMSEHEAAAAGMINGLAATLSMGCGRALLLHCEPFFKRLHQAAINEERKKNAHNN